MDVFDIKVEKANAILKYKRLEKITTLFRFMEICIFLFIISRFSTQLPLSFSFSGDFFRGVSITIFSPHFIFILGNAIVLVLFSRYGKFSDQESRINNQNIINNINFCNEYVESCQKNVNINPREVKKQGKQGTSEEKSCIPNLFISEDTKMQRSETEILKGYPHEDSCQKLQRTAEERVNYDNPMVDIKRQGKQSMFEEKNSQHDLFTSGNRKMERSKSEVFVEHHQEKYFLKLRRSVTEGSRRNVNYSEKVSSYGEDEMSGDEFRRTVEAFIARQQRNLREEEFSAVVAFGE